MIELVPEGQGDEPRISLKSDVITFINSGQVPRPPALNAYQCERRSGHIIMTIDIHPGVTPMFMGCKYQHCPGTMRSQMYPSAPLPETLLKLAPLWLWYRPSNPELTRDHHDGVFQHVSQGGLLSRRCPQNVEQFMEEWNAHH